jgi:isopenicillin N synthase-like dioxygenase
VADLVPIIDLTPWFSGGEDGRRAVAARVDEALRTSGFLLITGHGVPDEVRARARATAREFFTLPAAVKARYATQVGGRGWLPPGAEANGYAEGTETPPDLKESFSLAADQPTGNAAIDERWFRPNVWPAEVPELRPVVSDYIDRMHRLSDELMALCAVALGLPADHFQPFLSHPTYGVNLNWYPPMDPAQAPEPGQYRIGPHTDFGTVTVLDREPGRGGLQVCSADGTWSDAPYDPAALTINIGDLLARWTGDRWRSTRHRVLPPQPEAPGEDLLSLIFFYETNHDAVIESLPAPIGRTQFPPVVAHEYLKGKLDAITVS